MLLFRDKLKLIIEIRDLGNGPYNLKITDFNEMCRLLSHGEIEVDIYFDSNNFNILWYSAGEYRRIKYKKNGKLHRVNKLSFINKVGPNNYIKEYYIYDLLHKVNGTSQYSYMKYHYYCHYGLLNRYYGPTYKCYNSTVKHRVYHINDNLKNIVYYKDGKLHRDNNPAVWDKEKYTLRVLYFQEDLLHREDGPAKYECTDYRNITNAPHNTKIEKKGYYQNGKLCQNGLDIITYE